MKNMDETNCGKGDVSDTQVVSLANETSLSNSGLVFSDGTNMLTSADVALDDAGTAYVTLPLHFLQDGSILESGSGVHNLILKNLANNTVYLDTSQLTLLSGGSSQVVLSTDGIIEDGDGKIILDTENSDKISNKSSIIPGLGVDIATIDLTNLGGGGGSGDILSDPTEDGEVIKPGCLTFSLATTIAPPSTSKHQQNHQLHQPSSSRRGPGRPRREDTEVDPPIGKGPFKCEICGKEFSKSSHCKRHVKCHSDDKPFLCTLCSASFNVESNLILHKATHNVDDPRCPECNKKFSRIASLKAHVMLHEKEESLFCSECGDEFSTMAQLEEHKKEHQNEWVKPSNPQCRQCKWQFSRASALREHMKEHYKVKASLSHKSHKRNIDRSTFIHKCDICHKCFQKPSQLVRHKRIHTGERPYKCQLCPRAFNQKGSLQIHMYKHNGIKPFHCEFCAATFSQRGNLRAHIVRVHTIHSSGEQVYKCMECPCVFKKLGSLNAHMSRMHCGDGSQKIEDDCDTSHIMNVRAVLSQLAELEADIAGHKGKTPDQPSDSDILQQALVNSGLSGKDQPVSQGLHDISSRQKIKMEDGVNDESRTVRQHRDSSTTSYITLADRGLDGTVRRYIIRQRRVGTVRWHQCSYCTKEFKKPSDLVRHIRIHTRERPYKCTHCFRSFAVKSTLTAHIRTHTGVRDHVCYICLKKFSSASSLKVHIRMHTGTKPFACQYCDKSFRTTGHQKTHMLSHTKEGSGSSEERVARRKQARQKATHPILPEVPLQEPIIITNNGFVQAVARNSTVFLPGDTVSLDRPYKCNVCNAAFRKSSHLKQHIRMHTGERPYKCALCDRRFISNGVLKAHQRTHEGVKSYKCPECSNMFSTNGSLKRHMGTHSDMRPFMCPYCHKTFKTSVNCRKHMKTHKHELALQVAQQTSKEDGTEMLTSLPVDGQGPAVVTESTNFPPEGLGPDFAQAFSDQPFQVTSATEQQEQEESTFAQSTLVHTLAPDPLGDGTDPVTASGVITHTLHADATGTITLPSLAGQHTLTQENIREIERTLNEQIFGTAANITSDLVNVGGTSSDLAARVEVGDSEAESTTTEDLARTLGATSSPSARPDSSALGTLSEEPKNDGTHKNPAEPPGSSSVFGTTFDSAGFESCVFSAITLQNDPLELESLAAGASITTNMASILPPPGSSVPEAEPESALLSDPASKPELLVMSPMEGPVAAAAVAADTGDKDKNYIPGRPFNADAPPGERPFKCKQCSRAFKKSYHLKEHARSHVGKSLSCTLCERKCTTFGALRAHMKTHDGTRDYGCDVCGCRFTTNGSLKRHMIVHSDERPLKCCICNAMFRTDQLLRRHIKLHEPRERKGKLVATNPLQPPRGRRRAAIIRLTAEETLVLAQQPLDNAATVSEKVLIASAAEKDRISELKDPEQQYNMEPIHPNQCKYCPKSFRKPSDLVRHIRIHTGERPYKCACCKKCFTVKSTLDSHLKTHGGQKLFACHVCGCLFSTKGSLKVHMRLHTGAKPFKCPLCEMRFRTSGHRKAHLMSHMKHATSDGKLPSQLTTSSRRNKQVIEHIEQLVEEHELELQNPEPTTTSELMTEQMTHITLDPATLNSLIPGEPFNSSLLTTTADGSHIMGNFQLQLSDGLQIAEVDQSGTLQSYTTQTLQLDEALLQQLQASNIIIQTAPSNGQFQNHVEEGHTVEEQQHQVTLDTGAEMSTVRFEIHTDENGQIINIQPATLQEVPSRNGGDMTFDLTGGLDMEVVDGEQQPRASRFRVTDSRKGGRSLVAMGNQMPGEQKDKEDGSVSEDFLLFHDCATCGKHFSKPSQLERHTRIHTGERPFACPQCPKTFNQKNALNTHVKSHTGERPFPCPYCHYYFSQKGNLKTHMRRAHRFSSLELNTSSTISATTSTASPSTPTRSLLKPKQQPTLTNLNSSVDLAAGKTLDLEKVVGDLFPQMRNTTLADP